MNRFASLLTVLVMGVLIGACADAESSTWGRSESKAAGDHDPRFRNAAPAPPPRIEHTTHLAAGQMLERQGDFAGAIGQYEKAIAAWPRFAPAYNRLGIVYQQIGRLDEAEKILVQGVQADPSSVTLRNNLGYCYLLQQRYQEALAMFRDALAQDPAFKRARMNLAICLGKMGQTQDSLIEFSKVVSADVAHYNVGVICLHRGEYDRAGQAFAQALTINPKCPGAQIQLALAQRMAQGAKDLERMAGTVDPQDPDLP
jgi:Flp pilus assembly protein TadD